MKIHYKTIYIPHINYSVRIRPFKCPPSKIGTAQAWCERNTRSCCTVYVPKDETPSGLAHELVHVLRYIVMDRHMEFERECEHMAYIMQYVMGRALGYVWDR